MLGTLHDGTLRAIVVVMSRDIPSTSAEIAALARAAGLVGRQWSSWCCDDVVQDYVDAHDADADVDVWQAAYTEGDLERRRTIEGWIERWTTAPADYDWFGTTTLAVEGEWRGRELRRVLMHPQYATGQIDRYGSGLHGAWNEDPREVDRRIAEQAACDRALAEQREVERVSALTWLGSASEADLTAALDADEAPRGISRPEVRVELRRRAEAREAQAREVEYDRCLVLVAAHEVLVDDGAPARRSRWGLVPGRPSSVYYVIRVDTSPRDPERANVHASKQIVGSLEMVVKRLEEGSLRGARTADIPPEPVLRRIGHDRLADIRRIEAAGRVVWVGRPTFAQKELILDDRGHIVRSRAVVAAVEEILLRRL